MFQIFVFIVSAIVVLFWNAAYVLKEYEKGVVLRLGRYAGTRGAGLQILLPFIDKLLKVDQRVVTMDVPTQDVITKDNVSVKVNAVVYFRVMDPEKATLKVENYYYATSQLAQTTLRSVCGEAELDGLLSRREEFNQRIQEILDHQTDAWGIKVSLVEVKHIDLPQEMQRAMAKEAEAERERRAKIIKAEGEFQASEKLTQAAGIMSANPITIQLRYLETLRDIATENHSTVLFPIPMDILKIFADKVK
jgi:regulator of protease activity HflC (stomatin/prohibitin superfamily)